MKDYRAIFFFLFLALAVGAHNLPTAVQSQGTRLALVKQFDDGSYLISIDGVDHWAVDLAKTKELKSNEIKLQAAAAEILKLNDSLARSQSNVSKEKQNVQDERVEKDKLHKMYDGQVELSNQCFALLKRGGGRVGKFLDNPFVRLGIDVGKTTAQIATCR